MKIRVVSQHWFMLHGWGSSPEPVYLHPESPFWRENNFISIRHSAETNANCAVPTDGDNILKLRFDDSVLDPGRNLTLFDEALAEEIRQFVLRIDPERMLFINCGAGISRSGAVGEVLNDYFNKYLRRNPADDEYFRRTNPQILPNPLVRCILREKLFGRDCL